MARTIRIALFAILSALIIVFIFSNSMPSIPESRETSLSIAAWLRPFLDPDHRLSDDVFHVLIRKLAHFVEFGALGVSLTGLSVQLGWKKSLHRWSLPFLTAVLVAVLDETLQIFTGRGNSIRDVLLDSAGALCGVLFVAVICLLIRKRK